MSLSPSDGSFPVYREEIAGFSVQELAHQYGTPTYVYDAEAIQQRIADVQQFDVVRYAQKANSNIAILAMMKQHAVVLDAVSAGEIHRALRVGYSGGMREDGVHEIVYTADIFDDQNCPNSVRCQN